MTTSDTVETFSSLRPIEASIPTHSDSHERPRGSNLSRHTGHPPIPPQCRHICHPVLYVGPQLWLRRVVSHPNAAARTYGDLTSPRDRYRTAPSPPPSPQTCARQRSHCQNVRGLVQPSVTDSAIIVTSLFGIRLDQHNATSPRRPKPRSLPALLCGRPALQSDAARLAITGVGSVANLNLYVRPWNFYCP